MSQQTTPPGADNPTAPFDEVQASDPSSAGAARLPGAVPRDRIPTSGSLRQVIDAVLKGDADLDAFCHDHHVDVYRRFSDGMDRNRKVTLLLHHADRSAILAALYDAHPAATKRHEHLLRWQPAALSAATSRPGLVAAGLLALVALALAAWRIWPGPGVVTVARRHVLETWRTWSMTYRAIAPFAAPDGGVVLGGPWMATPAGDALCRELGKLHEVHNVRCVAPSADAGPDALERIARGAGAALVVDIGNRGLAQLTPLGPLAKEPLLGQRLAIDVAEEADRKRAVTVVSALARLGSSRGDFLPDGTPCPVDPAAPVDMIALLALLVVPSCEAVQVHARNFACPPGTTIADEPCALARYIDAELHLSDTQRARHLLEELRDQGPARFHAVARLALAHLDCTERAFTEAATALRELAERADACVLARIAETAACVASSADPGEIAPEITRLEALPIDPKGECPARMRARALAWRGYWRERSERWKEALADYKGAWHTFPDPHYGINLAEVWLHQGKPGQAMEVLSGVHCDAGEPPSCDAKAALLRWIAAGDAMARERAKDALLQLHKLHGSGMGVLGGSRDKLLRALACPGPASERCLHDVLARPSSRDELIESFRAAERLLPLRRETAR
ncbi:hypothetical protein [Sorangium sp. So ce1389]|uniref:hypothetical protein n=1 Tax=Sorangium sp. So ce1389 TaxID=3133336 RepID=UPI003F60E926